jgi:hypothetical protein
MERNSDRRQPMKKRKPMWLTKMYWRGPLVDITGKSLSIRTAWAYRLRQFAKRVLALRKGKRLIADIFSTLWVFMDVLALIKGAVPLLPFSIWGAIFGCLLVVFEWIIFREEFWRARPYMYFGNLAIGRLLSSPSYTSILSPRTTCLLRYVAPLRMTKTLQ